MAADSFRYPILCLFESTFLWSLVYIFRLFQKVVEICDDVV